MGFSPLPTPLHHHHYSLPSKCHGTRLIISGKVFPIFCCSVWWACMNCGLSFLSFSADRSGCSVIVCSCSPSASRFDMLCVQRLSSALVVTSCYSIYCCLTVMSRQVWPFSSDLWDQQGQPCHVLSYLKHLLRHSGAELQNGEELQ